MVYFMIEVTEQAAFQIKDMLKDAEDGEKYVRLAVHGGGCSGLSYGLGFEVEPKKTTQFLSFSVSNLLSIKKVLRLLKE